MTARLLIAIAFSCIVATVPQCTVATSAANRVCGGWGAAGFQFNNFHRETPAEALRDYAAAQDGVTLDVRLVIGSDGDRTRAAFGMGGLVMELLHGGNDGAAAASGRGGPAGNGDGRPTMPGADGPNPELSGGVNPLRVLGHPSFVSLESGQEQVGLTNGCWEMVWRDGSPSGTVICGFDVPKGAERNGVVLPNGRLYMNFPVWTRRGLEECVAIKREAEGLAHKYNMEKVAHLAKMDHTINPLMKALHYRNAFAAAEKVMCTKFRQMAEVPLDDVVAIEGELLLCSKGTVWRKDGWFQRGEHELLGCALVGRHQNNSAKP